MKKILLLLAEGFETYEASVFVDVIGWNLVDGDGTTELYSCGMKKEVAASFSQKWVVDYLLEDIAVEDFDALAIPGGFDEYNFFDEAYSSAFTDVIRRFVLQEKIVASVCVAALVLGRSGVLQGRRGTTYNLNGVRQAELQTYGVKVVNEPVVVDNNMITCWNPSRAIDVAYLLLEMLTSRENADHIKTIMGFA